MFRLLVGPSWTRLQAILYCRSSVFPWASLALLLLIQQRSLLEMGAAFQSSEDSSLSRHPPVCDSGLDHVLDGYPRPFPGHHRPIFAFSCVYLRLRRLGDVGDFAYCPCLFLYLGYDVFDGVNAVILNEIFCGRGHHASSSLLGLIFCACLYACLCLYPRDVLISQTCLAGGIAGCCLRVRLRMPWSFRMF